MKKLKKKIFLVIFIILTVFTTGVFCVYNAQLYNQNYRETERSLNSGFDMPFGLPNREEFGNIRFMDETVYTVVLNDDNSCCFVINHSNNDVSDESIEELAETLIQGESGHSIGNLYYTKYAYNFESGNFITIVDNSSTNSFLLQTLLVSLAVYILLEMVIILIANRIALWISKPVADSFDKQKQFIADASHELKTPLAVIMASSDALEANPAESKWLGNIKSEADRMNKLISDLLDLARSEEGAEEVQLKTGNLSKTVEMSCLTFEGIMFEKGIKLNYEIDENVELNMNVYKIKQLMAILLDNAVKHCSRGGEISVSLKKGKNAVLTVSNTGDGIPKGSEEKIFERFYRADDSRNRNENRYGLGLAIAKNIAALHNADISAKSENGLTTFKVIFR